ncbi:MAG: hypothetical protein NVS3B5_14830 [Sphingomicrobium sp.]
MLQEVVARPSLAFEEALILSKAQRGALHIGKLDCPARSLTLGERIAIGMRSFLRRRQSWISRPLANPKLEALRLLVCLQRYHDNVLHAIVRKELETEFTAPQIESLAVLARQPLP